MSWPDRSRLGIVCRDKGRCGVDEGALCLSSWHSRNPVAHYQIPTNRTATRTSTRPPPLSTSAPCPYRTRDASVPVIAAFGQQTSSGYHLPVDRRFIRFRQFWDGLEVGQFLGGDPAHFGGLPVVLDGVGRKGLEEVGVDQPVATERGILVFDDCAAPQHSHLVALQAGLFAYLRKCLFIGRHTGFDEAADAGPARVIAADTLAAARDQDARLTAIGAREEAGNNGCILYA